MSASRLGRSLRLSRPFGSGELALAFAALGTLAALAFAPRILHGGFHLDDWSNAVTSLQPPGPPDFGRAIDSFSQLTSYRPVLVVYVPLTYFVFGTHMHYHLAWAVVLGVFAVTTLYGSLRLLGVPWVHALAIAALTLIFPWSDSIRLWVTADQVTLSLALAGAGFFLALVGLDRRSWRLHGCAAALYGLSILTYEVTLPLVICAGLLYWFRSGWDEARWRWLADVAIAIFAGGWVGTHTTRVGSGVGGDLTHLKRIVEEGGTILAHAALPLGPDHRTLVLLTLGLVLGGGLAAYLLFPDRFGGELAWGLRHWLLMAFGGLAVAALGWLMFVPADPYYTPSIYGELNRVNGLAGYGLVLLLYGAFGILGSLVAHSVARSTPVAVAVTSVLALALFGTYLHVLRRHIEIWNLAYTAERTAIGETEAKFPRLPPGTTVFGSSYPANQVPGVPILTASWDYAGMLQIEYDDGSLSAYPVLPEQRIGCRRRAVVLERDGAVEASARYGLARLLNLQSGIHSTPRNLAACQRVAANYPAGPLYLSPSY